jgi:predicted ATPase
VVSLSYAAWTVGSLGYLDQALKRVNEALTLAQKVSLPLSYGVALIGAAIVFQSRREARVVQEQAETVIALATEQGLPLLLTRGAILRGWALTAQGRGEEGIAQMRQGLAGYRAIGAEAGLGYFLGLLAEAYGEIGQAEEGLGLVAEALAQMTTNGEHNYEEELYRLKGELTLQQSKVQGPKSKTPSTQHRALSTQAEAEAEACFHKAIEMARRRSAKTWELRAAVSLARLWRRQGKREEARRLLAEIYGWFTEGFETADLKGARALSEGL